MIAPFVPRTAGGAGPRGSPYGGASSEAGRSPTCAPPCFMPPLRGRLPQGGAAGSRPASLLAGLRPPPAACVPPPSGSVRPRSAYAPLGRTPLPFALLTDFDYICSEFANSYCLTSYFSSYGKTEFILGQGEGQTW